jgi:hypothetical protein
VSSVAEVEVAGALFADSQVNPVEAIAEATKPMETAGIEPASAAA